MNAILAAVTILLGFGYAFVNGYHDGGNVIATIIASRSIKVRQAFIIGCLAEFFGAIVLGTAVAKTIGTGIVIEPIILESGELIGTLFIICAIAGSIVWNLITAVLGLPSSSSHALMGGLLGAGIAAFGFNAINWTGFMLKIMLVMFASPILGFLIGFAVMKLFQKILINHTKKTVEKQIKKAQWFSVAGLALSHGSSDSQKAMGLIALELMVLHISSEFIVPWWTILGCATMISLGMSVGGWKIMHTVGRKLYKIEPVHSLTSQLAAASIIAVATLTGLPVSTTQIVTSSVMGVGAAENPKKVKWIVANKIVASWFITIPAAAAVSGILMKSMLSLSVWIGF